MKMCSLQLAGLSQNLDKVAIDTTHGLVDDGITNPEEVKRHLKIHVKALGEVGEGSRSFFPTVKTIRNHMSIHQHTNLKTDDQGNLKKLVSVCFNRVCLTFDVSKAFIILKLLWLTFFMQYSGKITRTLITIQSQSVFETG